MKKFFIPSKANIIYAAVAAIIIMFFSVITYGLNGFAFGHATVNLIVLILVATLIATLFWAILGGQEKGGTTTFNIVLTLMLFNAISELKRTAENRQRPIQDIQKAMSDYKEKTLQNPDSINVNYAELSGNIKKGIDDLIKISDGEEKELYLILKNYFKKSDSINMNWNHSYETLMGSGILNAPMLNNKKGLGYHKKIVQNYINKSEEFKSFGENRIEYLRDKTQYINAENKVLKGFFGEVIKKDSVQKLVFIPYINAHISYGENLKEIIDLLEKEKEKWIYENETIIFQNDASKVKYNELLNKAIENEKVFNELSLKFVEVM